MKIDEPKELQGDNTEHPTRDKIAGKHRRKGEERTHLTAGVAFLAPKKSLAD